MNSSKNKLSTTQTILLIVVVLYLIYFFSNYPESANELSSFFEKILRWISGT